jgi:ABC-type antimicrobial peptide transport system permease subunit
VRFDGLPESATPTVSKISVDEQFGKVFGLELLEGRWFEPGRENDHNHVILNETAAKKLGLPQPWVGQRFSIHGQEGRVIGLVRDFHFLPLREAIPPLVMFSGSNWRGNYFVKTQPGKSAQALALAEKAWKQWFPDRPFKYTFLDDDFNRLYRAEQQAGILFNLFAGIAIFIACLGLFGLATFMATQRTKEIGIRKVLGATVLSITGLLAKDFLKLVLLAILISIPIAYYFMEKWLADFAYRIELQGWVFALAGAAAIVLAVITVGVQSIRAALLNPVKSLRSE